MSSPKPNVQDDCLQKNDAKHFENIAAEAVEDTMSPWECIRMNPKIVLWTLYANLGSIMIGYENVALSVCLAMPAFQMTFASEINGELLIPAYWQSLWNAIFNVMTMVGSICAGIIQDRFGRRVSFLVVAITAAAGTAISFVANTPAEFLGGKIVAGYALGSSVIVTQAYVSEVAPSPMRGIALSVNTIALNLGLLTAISVTFSRISIMNPIAFRAVFAGAWAFPGLLLLGLPFLPESPYWLVNKGKNEQARNSLVRLMSPQDDIDARLARIEATVELERRTQAESGSLAECFRGFNLRRTLITLINFYMPSAVGSNLASNAPYFLNQTGLSSHMVLLITQVGISAGVLSAIVNILLMMRFGNRNLMFAGTGICVAAYLAMGVAGALPRTSFNLAVVGVALQFSSLSYGPAVGAAMATAGEVSSTRLRAKTLSVGNAFNGIVGTFWQFVLPYLFNKDQADLGGNLGWIFFGIAVIYLGLVFFFVPETKGRSFEDLEIMFEKKLPARAFKTHNVNGHGDM